MIYFSVEETRFDMEGDQLILEALSGMPNLTRKWYTYLVSSRIPPL